MKQKVFVYGTLKSDKHNNDLLKNSTLIGKAWTKKEYTLLEDHYNGLPYVTREPSYPIAGEVYEVDEWTFMMLDNLEGHPHFYCRELIEIFIPCYDDFAIDDGRVKYDIMEDRAWLYFIGDGFNTRQVRKLPDGKW